MQDRLTPKQVAQAIGVSESSIKRWCDAGELPFAKTGGGHRRLEARDVISFCRESGHTLADARLLGLPSNTGKRHLSKKRAAVLLTEALSAGDQDACLRILFDLYLANVSVATICDDVVAKAMQVIGEKWLTEGLRIYQERRACTIIGGIIAILKRSLPLPRGPLAIGGSIGSNPYTVAHDLVDATLYSAGWQSALLGNDLPADEFLHALQHERPGLLWISVGTADEHLGEQIAMIARACEKQNVLFVIGGRGLQSLTAFPASAQHFNKMVALAHHLATVDRDITT